jgi:hypothetical protein
VSIPPATPTTTPTTAVTSVEHPGGSDRFSSCRRLTALLVLCAATITAATILNTHHVDAHTPAGQGRPISPVTPDKPPIRDTPPGNTPVTNRRVVIISDSAMAGIRWSGALSGLRGFNAETYLESCRRLVAPSCRGREGYAPPTAAQHIGLVAPAGPLDILVIAVGYNDDHTRFPTDFNTVMAAARARGFQQTAWVTYRSDVTYSPPAATRASNYWYMNRVLRAAVRSGRHPDLQLWDLNRYTRTANGWFTADGVHETPLGAWGVADWLSRHVAAIDRRRCPAPWTVGADNRGPCRMPDRLPQRWGMPAIADLYPVP